jgi:FemAB-related protein (PEP-CTERM system-associated)
MLAQPQAFVSDGSLAVTVRAARAADRASWNAFVFAQPEGTFFHRFEWSEVLANTLGHRTHYLLVERDGGLAGVLPLAEMRSALFGHALISTPFCVYGGALAVDETARKTLEQHACTLAQSAGVAYLEMRNRSPVNADWPEKGLYVTFRKAVSLNHEENLKAIPRKQRAEVRKGIKLGLKSRIDADCATLYDLYSESLRNLGTPVFGANYLRALQNAFGADCEVLTVLSGGVPVSSVMSFYFRDEVLPYYGGGSAAARTVAANDFMYWEVMRRAADRGCRVFDFGRSKRDSGSYAFKKHWGFEESALSYEYALVRATEIPNLSPTNAKYALMIGVWRRLPLWLTRIVGPPIARYLG